METDFESVPPVFETVSWTVLVPGVVQLVENVDPLPEAVVPSDVQFHLSTAPSTVGVQVTVLPETSDVFPQPIDLMLGAVGALTFTLAEAVEQSAPTQAVSVMAFVPGSANDVLNSYCDPVAGLPPDADQRHVVTPGLVEGLQETESPVRTSTGEQPTS